MEDFMGYSFGLTCFVDILGSKNSSFNDALKMNNLFRRALETTNQMYTHQRKIISSFSDCAYIIYEINDGSIINQNIYMLLDLSIIAKTLQDFILYGFLFRGGISCGDVYFDNDKNILFGPSVNEVYKLEVTGKMPRLIVESKIAERLIKYYNESKDERVDSYKYLILQDEKYDKRYYLNYLWKFIHLPTQFNVFYNTGREFSESNIEKQMHSIETDYEIIAKHNWNLNYLERIKNIIENNKLNNLYDSCGTLKY
jgi:hypothetical protein